MASQKPSSSTSEDSKKRSKRDKSSCRPEEDEKIINSSSSSSSTPRWKHDVFLSFYGEDTRQSFTDHLYVDLKRKGILVFRDDEELKRGEYIPKALVRAILESQYAIVIISTNYASSKHCLMELAEIVECEKNKKLTIVPVFYHVNPDDVTNQEGSFAQAFAAHEEDTKIDNEKIKIWRNALRNVCSIAGWHIDDGYESTFIQKISGSISRELSSRFSRHDYDKLVAIDSHVEEIMKLLDMESNGVRFIGIHGMGGIGKTTLAEIIYDRVSNCRFEGSSFISCIREKSTTARDLASLQKEFLSMIMQEEIQIWDHNQGSREIKTKLQNKKVFIVLDDVDSDKQLSELAGSHDWFGPGSRVIITCRDSHLLRRPEVKDIYRIEQLRTAEALLLFCLSAFQITHPPEDYKELSMDFVNYAQGLPLALKVLGSFLRKRTIDAWKSARDQLEATPKKEIFDILKISFEGLEDSQQKLFLDIACFFQGEKLDNNFKEILQSFGYYPDINIDVLVDKSLISKSKYETLIMHDLLKRMGEEIVRRECPEEPGQRSRLFRHDDVFHVLKNDTGSDAIEGIILDFCPKESLNAKSMSKMRNLRFFKIPNHCPTIEWHGDPLKFLPTSRLRILHWFGYPLKSWPSNFQPKNLTVISMSESRFEQLWMGPMVLDNLKEFDLSYSENLIETPDLTGAPNLEKINLRGCRSLSKVDPSIGILKRLKEFDLNECSSLEMLPDLSRLECLTEVWAHKTAITQIPSVNLIPKSIRSFNLEGRKLMRDPNYDIGPLAGYQMQGIYDHVEVVCIDFDSEGKNILDMAGGFVASLDDDAMMISGWSLGFHIPEWVQNKRNGSSVKIDLDGNKNPDMGCAFFIVCDYDKLFFLGDENSSISDDEDIMDSTVMLRLCFETDEELCVECLLSYELMPSPLNVLVKRIGFWVYIPAVLRFLDTRRVIKISFETRWLFEEGFVDLEVEVKECGLHSVCPDGANSKFYNSIAPFGLSGSSNSDFHRRFHAYMEKKRDMRKFSPVHIFRRPKRPDSIVLTQLQIYRDYVNQLLYSGVKRTEL